MFDSKIASSNRLWPALALLLLCLALPAAAAGRYADRFVWVFGWNLGKDSDVAANHPRARIRRRSTACNGAVLSAGLDYAFQTIARLLPPARIKSSRPAGKIIWN